MSKDQELFDKFADWYFTSVGYRPEENDVEDFVATFSPKLNGKLLINVDELQKELESQELFLDEGQWLSIVEALRKAEVSL